MIDLEISMDMKDLEKWEIFTERQKKSALKIVAAEGMRFMRERTAKGIAVDGSKFKAYDPGYQDRKQRAGRMGEGFWLRLSGWMWKTQKFFIERIGPVLRAVITFEGMRPQVKITDPQRERRREMPEIRMAPFQQKWEGTARAKRSRKKQSAGARLTVNIDSGDMVSSATVAEANNRIRPFIGFNSKEADKLTGVFSEALDKVKKK